jgi:hypothetical protein
MHDRGRYCKPKPTNIKPSRGRLDHHRRAVGQDLGAAASGAALAGDATGEFA